ncbi:MAG: hypothetical protein AMDU4_FER2C00189G0006 [Ferroplasma sp. Type II]|nr:MAG: hypothetical protein AMDU4_FER2C00189G0006 [Ferroplasma sp. Type II]
MNSACATDTQKPRPFKSLISDIYFSVASLIRLARSSDIFPLDVYSLSSSPVSYRPLLHDILSRSTESVIPKYWNGLKMPLSIASGNRISDVIWLLKYFSMSFPSILSGVAVRPSSISGLKYSKIGLYDLAGAWWNSSITMKL